MIHDETQIEAVIDQVLTSFYSSHLRRCRGEWGHPGLEHLTPELEWVLPDKHEVDGLEQGELVQEDATADSDDEETKLGHDHGEVGDTEDLGGDDTADTHRGEPHDDADHPHDALVHHREELNNTRSLGAERSKNSAKSQAEEDDSQGVCSIP